MAAEPTQERIDRPTPSGGKYSIAYFHDDAGKPVSKGKATGMEIVEFNDKDVAIKRTYLAKGGAP